MADINGTNGDDVFTNSASNDTYFGGAGNDTLQFGFGSGTDRFFGGNDIDTVQLSASLFNVSYVQDTFIDYAPIQDFDFARKIVLSDGSTIDTITHFEIGWERFQAADSNLLTVFFSGGGPGGSLSVTGTAANELFGGSSAAQSMSGGDGNDVLYANGGADTVFGGNGFDYVSAGLDNGTNDSFDGGADIDIISYSGSGAVTIDLNAGYAAGTSIGFDTLLGFEIAVGSQVNDVIIGTTDANTLHGLGGNDYFYTRSGNDLVFGGTGTDVLLGEGGNDVLNGGDDTDYLYGGAGTNTLNGDNGVDVLYAEGTSDVMNGGEGGDYFYSFPGAVAPTASGGNGNDIYTDLAGGAGSQDTFNGEDGQDYCYAFGGNDTFFGGAGVDVFLAGAGNDIFDGGTDVDYAWGEAGNDTFITRPTNGVLVLNDFAAGGAEDSVRLLGTSFTNLAEVLAAMTFEAGLNTTILTIDADTNVWFIGVQPGQFTASDFLFS